MSDERASSFHHYIPQFLLRNFRDPATGTLSYFSKDTRREHWAGVKKVAGVEGYYTDGEGDASLEAELGTVVEDPAAPVIGKLVSDFTCAPSLGREELDALRRFLAVQTGRTPRGRAHTEALREAKPQIAQLLRVGPGPEAEKNWHVRSLRALMNSYRASPAGRWPLFLTVYDDGLALPDNGVVAYHEDLRKKGYVDLPMWEMRFFALPVSPHLLLVSANPDGGQEAAGSATYKDLAALASGQAEKSVFYRRGSHLAALLPTFQMPVAD